MRKITLTLAALVAACGAAHADNWMKYLPDDAYVAEVSLPGAHDSGTGNGCGRVFVIVDGTPYAQTQDIEIAQQWAVGVRAFDLRPCTTSSGYLNVNHGIVPTNLRFDEAMYTLRDSLAANPTEFAVIHLLHESDGDSGSYDFQTLLHELFDSDELKDYLVDYRRNLTVGDLRGKILVLYRDSYSTRPTGGLMTGWTGNINWSAQTSGKITGAGSDANATGTLYMQDFSNTSEEGGVDQKLAAMQTMLDFSTQHRAQTASDLVWVFNFASAYSQMTSILGLVDVSLADGYRDNATYTNAAIVEYLQQNSGPTGIVLADYVGVDSSTGSDGNTYQTMGETLVKTIIENNFKYLDYQPTNAKEALERELGIVEGKAYTANTGDEAFQIPTRYAEALSDATQAANNTLADPDATDDDYTAALTALQEAAEALENAPLVEPEEGDIFSLTLVADGFTYGGNPLSFYEGTNTSTGNYGLTFMRKADPNYGQAYTFHPQDDTLNGYTISFTDVQGETRYLCLGSVYGNSSANIRTTTDTAEAFTFTLIATTGEQGIWHLYNSEAMCNIGSSGGSTLTSSDTYCDLSLQPARRLTVTPTTADGWATLCLPFVAQVPDGWTAYTCEGLDDEQEATLALQEAWRIEANTPYIVSCPTEETFTGTGTYYNSYTTTAGCLTGTVEEAQAPAGSYILDNPADPGVAFYPAGDEGATIQPYQCYISASLGEYQRLYIPGTTTSLAAARADTRPSTTYDLQGRPVSHTRKGVYIVGDKKILVR